MKENKSKPPDQEAEQLNLVQSRLNLGFIPTGHEIALDYKEQLKSIENETERILREKQDSLSLLYREVARLWAMNTIFLDTDDETTQNGNSHASSPAVKSPNRHHQWYRFYQ